MSLIFIVICFIDNYESSVDIKVANVTLRELIYSLVSPGLSRGLYRSLRVSLIRGHVEVPWPDRNFSSRFRSALSGQKNACRRLSQSPPRYCHKHTSSETLPLNNELASIFPIRATTKVPPASRFSALGTSRLEQPPPNHSSTRDIAPRSW